MTDFPRRVVVRRAPAPSAVHDHYYETAIDDPDVSQIWCYTAQLSYRSGDTLDIHVSTTSPVYSLEIVRDGAEPTRVLERSGLEGTFHPAPRRCSVEGCGWPVAVTLPIPSDWIPGAYVVKTAASDGCDGRVESEHLFLLRAADEAEPAPLLLLAATSTWIAYNDWGGSNHYEGLEGSGGDLFSPTLSIERPWTKGFVSLPPQAPRIPLEKILPPNSPVRYPHMEWAFANGYSKKYASAGWASYERLFVCWAETAGYRIDYATQHDLHFLPGLLDRYRCVVIVGHDEYWTGEMRDAVDAYVDAGGHVARFAGNFLWQIRLEDAGRQQTCFKYRVAEDPLRGTDRATTCWGARQIGRPGASTFGLNGTSGVYAGWGGCAPRGAGGFTVYRPEHWAFEGTGLCYGDVVGARSRVFGYEVDGVDFSFRHGLPIATGDDGAVPERTEIVAMAPASVAEDIGPDDATEPFIGALDLSFVAMALFGGTQETDLQRVRRGAGMMAEYRRGDGTVFNAGSCEWVAGLAAADPFIDRITRNVLDRFGCRSWP